jgi:hypothetical protein
VAHEWGATLYQSELPKSCQGGAIPATLQDVRSFFVRPPPEPGVSPKGSTSGSYRNAFIRTLRAVEHIRRMRGGSQSHFMRCSDENYYVVKFQNNPQHSRILVNDLLGTKLAALMGLPTTAVAIIEVSEDLIRLTPDLRVETSWTGNWTATPCQSGLQFGSRYPGDPQQLTVFDFLPGKQASSMRNVCDFAGMLVFDLWTCNTDPRQVIFGRQEVGTPFQGWMIDQGFCFNGREWNFPDKPRRNLYDRKNVYEQVQGIESFEPWLARLESERVRSALWAIAGTIPPEWYEFDFESLQALLVQLDSRRCRVRELLWSARNSNRSVFPNWVDGLNQASNPLAASDIRNVHQVLLPMPPPEVISKIKVDPLISNKRNKKKYILRASTKLGNLPALSRTAQN